MSLPQTAVTTTINRGGQAANKMSQEKQPSAFDVWSHSYDGMANRMQSAATNPASILDVNAAQLANVASAATNMQSSSLSQAGGSIAAQAGALGDSVAAIGQAQGALETVGATFALLTGVEQMLSSALSFIPFPSFPALRIADFDIGLPHAHSHPPNLIPPAPPVPLPSTGPVIPIPILSGATQTLINGMPAARCGDMGLGVWCGGYFPMYEVFLGSSNVWIEGARAARLLVDITKHCMFTVPKPSDPPLGPMIGTTISASPNVLIGGIPMPSLTALAMGAAVKGAFKLAGKGAKAFARLTAPLRRRLGSHLDSGFLKCKILRAEPVNFATGEVIIDQRDYDIPGLIPFDWTRHYGSHSSRKGVCGYGWDTPADARLILEKDGAVLFHDGLGGAKIFPYLPAQGAVQEFVDGSTLGAAGNTLWVHIKSGLTYVFARSHAHASELLVQRVEDACGNYLQYLRDEHGLHGIVESAGRRIHIKTDQGLIREMWLSGSEPGPAHLLVRYEYGAEGELLTVYDSLEQPYRFRYELRRVVQHTTRNGLSFYYAYESGRPSARCHRSWGDGGLFNYQFEFDPATRRIAIKDSLGAVSAIQLNELNLPLWEIDPLGGMTRYEYDDRGRTTGITDPDGRSTTYEYDAHGNVLKITRPDGKCTETAFDADGRALRVTAPNGSLWEQTWDARGLLLKQISPLGHVASYEYDHRGQLTAVTNPRGARTELQFDSVGNLTHFRNALGHTIRFAYDIRGNITDRWDPLGKRISYRYDAKSRLTDVYLPSRASVRCAYDGQDNLIQYTDENAGVTLFEFFGQGHIARCVQPDGRSVLYQYDTEERLTSITNQRGEVYQLRRDALGRVITEIDYWNQHRRYTYSPGGKIQACVDALGRVTTFETDKLGRISKRSLKPLSKTEAPFEETFTYDVNGNLLTASNPHVSIERAYDVEDRMLSEKQGDYFLITNRYDEVGNRVSRRTALTCGGKSTGHEVDYAYDLRDQIIAITVDHQQPIRIERDAIGQALVEQLNPALRREFEYSADGYRTRQRVTVGTTAIIDVAYHYDAAGNLTEKRGAAFGLERFIYDPMGRVTQHLDPHEAITHYIHDAAGDRLTTRILSVVSQADSALPGEWDWIREGTYDGARYRYDRAGNLIERQDDRGRLKLVWDAHQRLVESRIDDAVTTYEYDPLGRRVSKRTGDRLTRFAWDGDTLVAESCSKARDVERVREWVYVPESFAPLVMLPGEAEPASVLHYHNDPNGCPTHVTDGKGQTKWAASYTAWGEISRLHVSAVDQPLRLQGQYEDEETGLRYNRSRYYCARIGAFISQDPIGLMGGLNVYEFAPNTQTWVDPLGLTPLNDPGYAVYALYHPGETKPYYVGITKQGVDERMAQHARPHKTYGTARFDPENDTFKILQQDLKFKDARGFEQAYIEHFGTRKGFPSNVQNSFDKARTDTRGKAFKRAYNQAKRLLGIC